MSVCAPSKVFLTATVLSVFIPLWTRKISSRKMFSMINRIGYMTVALARVDGTVGRGTLKANKKDETRRIFEASKNTSTNVFW